MLKMKVGRKILLVEDDLTFRVMLKTWLGKKGFIIRDYGTLREVKKALLEEEFDLILSDLRLPDGEGTSILGWIQEEEKEIPVVIMTSYAEIQSAVEAMKRGAKDYIAKPFPPDELLGKINEVLGENEGEIQIERSDSSFTLDEKEFLAGESDAAKQVYHYLSIVAPTPLSVLIQGASGTGKEYVAKRIYQLSKRDGAPFVAIDCGAIPKELAASEFFGHQKGAFTGAVEDKVGAFEAANGGTVFLDEIGNLSYDVQIQLLRALEERKIRPLGSNRVLDVDIRLISATNEDLEQAMAEGRFREDLFHRINEFSIDLPELKEREGDLILFANFFLEQSNEELGKKVVQFNAEALELLESYSWPGNLRELKNCIRKATLLATGDEITPNELLDISRKKEDFSTSTLLFDEDREKRTIIKALEKNRYNKSKTAKELGIDRKTLYNKLDKYRIK